MAPPRLATANSAARAGEKIEPQSAVNGGGPIEPYDEDDGLLPSWWPFAAAGGIAVVLILLLVLLLSGAELIYAIGHHDTVSVGLASLLLLVAIAPLASETRAWLDRRTRS